VTLQVIEHRAVAEEVGLVVEQRLDHLLGERRLVRLAQARGEILERIEALLAQHAGQRGAHAPQPVGRELLPGARLEQAGDDAERVLAVVDHADTPCARRCARRSARAAAPPKRDRGGDRAGHAPYGRTGSVLRHDRAAGLDDLRCAFRAVAPHARKHHAQRVRAEESGAAVEHRIDRRTTAARDRPVLQPHDRGASESAASVRCASPGATMILPGITGMPSRATSAGRPDATRSWRTNGSMNEPGRCWVTTIGSCTRGVSAPSSWLSA
jgi:hypothetical protein